MYGYWQVDHLTILLVITGAAETRVKVNPLVEVTQDEDELCFHYHLYDERMIDTLGYKLAIIPDPFIQELPIKTRRAYLEAVSVDGQTSFRLNVSLWYDLYSVTVANPSMGLLSQGVDDPKISTLNQDGQLGLLAYSIGLSRGNVSPMYDSCGMKGLG